MGGVRHRLIGFIIAAVMPVIAIAQQDQALRDRDPDLSGSKKVAADLQRANFHFGSWYLLSRIRIADAGYTEGFYVPTGDQSGGLALTVEAPNRLYYVPHRKVVLSADLVPSYSFFQASHADGNDGRDGQFNYLVRGDAQFLLNHLYLDLYTLRADQLRAHVADINRLATLREDEHGAAGELKYSSRTSALFGLRYRDDKYPLDREQPDDRPVNLLDHSERNARLSLMHKTLPLTSFFVSGEVSDYAFTRATYKDSLRTFYGGGLVHDTGRTMFRLEAGRAKLDFDKPGERDFSGITGDARLTRRNGRWSYNLGGARDLGFSIFAFNDYYVSTTGNFGIDYVATRRLTLRTGIAAERDDYDVEVSGFHRRDTISFSSVGFTYTIGRVASGLDVGYYERDSTYGGDEDSGIRFVVHLSFTP